MDSSMGRHNPAPGSKQQLAWDAIANHWEQKQNEGGVDGNDMFRQLQPGQNVLDLGTVRRGSKRKRLVSREFDIITISTTLKSLPSLEPIAEALPLLLNEDGCVIIIDLHPASSKPSGHRSMKIDEDPSTGKQQFHTNIKMLRYLNIPPSQSEAV
ncbi:hypothetical protein LTR56_028236 [Elasticomyces elasticus]|nr:hypothetical protein LTR56_028236 [Elasticomyces elasticus]